MCSYTLCSLHSFRLNGVAFLDVPVQGAALDFGELSLIFIDGVRSKMRPIETLANCEMKALKAMKANSLAKELVKEFGQFLGQICPHIFAAAPQ